MRVGLRECVAALLLGWLLLALAACGGSGAVSTPAGRGRVKLTITWPFSRVIPAETRSIRVVAKVLEPADGPEIANQVVARPEGQATSQIVLEDIPSVKVRITATAYAATDGTGNALAAGSQEVTVPENNAVAANITLVSTGDCEMPSVSAYAKAVSDTGEDSVIDAGQKLTASAQGSSSFTLGATHNDPGVVVPTAAVASVDRGQLTGSILNIGVLDLSILDQIVFDGPGMTGQAGEVTIVMDAKSTSVSGAKAATYIFLVESGGEEVIDTHGSVIRGNQTGDAPLNGEVRGTVHFTYGQAQSIYIEVHYAFNILDPPAISNQPVHWKFVRFEGLSTGATVRSLSCDDWPNGGG